MAMKVCAEPGCPTITPTTRCPQHRSEREQARGTRQQRGYDTTHDHTRREAVHQLRAGHTLTCWRCGGTITNEHNMHIGHDDHDRTITRGPEHKTCNLQAAGRQPRISPDA